MMNECAVNTIRIGEFAWYYMEPEEGVYRFDLFDRVIGIFAQHGIKTILGTPSATPPKWLTSKYPGILPVDADGRTLNDQSRRHYTYNSHVYRRYVRRIVEEMARHYSDNPNVVGWQIDNEFNCHINEFFTESDRKEFRAWLKDTYDTLDNLNERWGTKVWSQWYTDWDQIDLPFSAPTFHNPALMLDFRRFTSDSVISFQKEQIDIIRKYRPDDFITHNGTFKYIDYYKFCNDLDIYSHDNYPCFRSYPQYYIGSRLTKVRRFMNSFFIMEQQTGAGGQTYLLRTPRPGEMSLWAFQAIAHGADGMLHFRWRTALKGAEEYWYGVLEQDNVKRRQFHEFRKEGRDIAKIVDEVYGTKIISDIAILRDFENEWVYDDQYLSKEIDIRNEFTDYFRAASELKYNIDVIGPHSEFERYKIIIAPYMLIVDTGMTKRIKEFVENGGVFIATAHSAVKDRDNSMTDRTQPIFLTDLFGMEREDFNCYPEPSREKNALVFSDGERIPIHVFSEGLKVRTAKIIASWDRDYFEGKPACTENAFGKGKAVYYGSFQNLEASRYLIRRYAEDCGLKPLFGNFPADIEVTRRTGTDAEYYFILNHNDATVEINTGAGYYDLIERKPFPGHYTFKAFEYKVLKK